MTTDPMVMVMGSDIKLKIGKIIMSSKLLLALRKEQACIYLHDDDRNGSRIAVY